MRTLVARTAGAVILSLAAVAHAGEVDTSQPKESVPSVQYRVTNLSTFGGTPSRGNGINDLGWIAGYSTLSGNASRHASLWRYGAHRQPRRQDVGHADGDQPAR